METELKLTIDKAYCEKLLQHPVISQYQHKPLERYQLYSVYFDTADHDLLQNGYVLRIRSDSKVQLQSQSIRYLQTVKTANESEAGLHRRFEWHREVAGMTPDLTVFEEIAPDEPLLINATSLAAIFITDMIRTSIELVVDGSVIELALDIGKVISHDSETELTEDLSEVELELLSGEQEKLFLVAELLGRDLPLKAEDQSKAERGYRLHSQIINKHHS